MLAHGNSRALTVATYNIHKGFSHFNRRMVVHDLRDRLRLMGADVMFLQEVVGGDGQCARISMSQHVVSLAHSQQSQ